MTVRPQTFMVYVEDKPGVLNRVASLFRRRAYNIESLTVGHTEKPGVSRMTIVTDANDVTALRIEANLYKLVNVLRVENVTDSPAFVTGLALIKVKSTSETRAEMLQLATDVYNGRVVDLTNESIIVEVTGTEDKINNVIEVFSPFGIIEMARTGAVAMQRGAEAPSLDPEFVSATVPVYDGVAAR